MGKDVFKKMIYSPISMLLAFTVSNFLLIDQADSLRCRLMSEYEVYRRLNNGSEKLVPCLPCPKCPLGHGLEPQCGSRIPQDAEIKCVLCDQGRSYSDEESVGSCKPCNECENRQILKNCTLISNRKCHDTKCKPGYYFNELLSNCLLTALARTPIVSTRLSTKSSSQSVFDKSRAGVGQSNTLATSTQITSTSWSTTSSSATIKYETLQSAPTTVSKKNETLQSDPTISSKKSEIIQSDPSIASEKNETLQSGSSIASKSNENIQPDPSIASKKEYTTLNSVFIGLFVLLGLLLLCCFIVAVVFAIVYVGKDKRKRKKVGPNYHDPHSGDPLLFEENNPFEMRRKVNEEEFQRLIERVPEDIKVSDMPLDLREKVEMMLDTPTSQHGWRKVGSILGLDRIHLGYLNTEFLKPNGSPTSQILESLNASYITMTVRELVEAIHQAKRDDIARQICNWPWNGYYETVI